MLPDLLTWAHDYPTSTLEGCGESETRSKPKVKNGIKSPLYCSGNTTFLQVQTLPALHDNSRLRPAKGAADYVVESPDADTVIAARYPPKIGAALFYLEWTRMIEHGYPRNYEMHEASGRVLEHMERTTRDVMLTKLREWMVEEGYGDDCEEFVLDEDELPHLSNPPREDDEGDEPATT